MPAVGFFCPSIFRPTTAAPSDPAVLEVARAIYFCGRADGAPGMETVAHVIQNRMKNPAFPSEALSVVTTGSDQFQDAGRQPMPVIQGTPEKQMFERAKSMAAQLVYPPYRLSCPDPTGGRIRDDLRAAGNRCTSLGESRRSSSDDELSDGGDLSPPPASPRPVLPTRSRRPLAFLKEQSVTGVSTVRRPYVDAAGTEQPVVSTSSGDTATTATPSAASESLGRSESETSSSSKSSSVHQNRLASAGMAPATHAGDQPVRPSTPPPVAPPSSSSMPNPSSIVTANTPPATLSSRLIGRSLRGSRSSGANRGNVNLGPADDDGYHDMILPCGLLQDEVIEFMYRDLSPEDFEKLSKLDERVPKRNTAQRNLVDGLPRVPAKDAGVSECSVCLVSFEPNQSVVKLPCSHCFHHACISKWLTQCKNTCPLCSAPITSASSSGAASATTTSPTRSTMRTL